MAWVRAPGRPEAAEWRASLGFPSFPPGPAESRPHGFPRKDHAAFRSVFCPLRAGVRLLEDSEMALHFRLVPSPRLRSAFLL